MADAPSKKRWDAENTKVISVKFMRRTDQDVIDFLENKNKHEIICAALREYKANHTEVVEKVGPEPDLNWKKSDYELVLISPELRASMQRILDDHRRRCAESYLEMLRSMSGLPEEQLVNGALNLERERADGVPVGGGYGNHWLQALSIKNPVSALLVCELIEDKDFPEPGAGSQP